MAIFSTPPALLGPSSLFARLRGEHQLLVFQVALAADASVEVSLPLPVAAGRRDEVRLISMASYPFFFADLAAGFSQTPPSPEPERDAIARVDDALPASFLALWPGYASYSAVSFPVRSGPRASYLVALSFPSRHPEALYFPTVHCIDAARTEVALDCVLYAQPGEDAQLGDWWQRSGPARGFMRRSRGIVDAYQPCCRGALDGMQPNGDRLVPLSRATS
jgi:hypothetical protein